LLWWGQPDIAFHATSLGVFAFEFGLIEHQLPCHAMGVPGSLSNPAFLPCGMAIARQPPAEHGPVARLPDQA